MRLGVVLVVALLALAACADDATTGTDPDRDAGSTSPSGGPTGGPIVSMADLAGRTFVSEALTDPDHELVPGSTVTLGFEEGRVAAYAGCNRLFGGAEIRDGVLVVDRAGGTMMACSPELMAQDDWLVALLQGSPALTLDGDTLILTRAETVLTLAEQRPAAAPPVEGTRWIVDSVVSGTGEDGAVASVPQGVRAWLEVHGGTLQVATGCNRGSAEVDVTSTRWTVGPMRTTKMACADDGAAAVEQAVLTVLDGEVAVSQDGRRLRLTTLDGGAGLDLVAG